MDETQGEQVERRRTPGQIQAAARADPVTGPLPRWPSAPSATAQSATDGDAAAASLATEPHATPTPSAPAWATEGAAPSERPELDPTPAAPAIQVPVPEVMMPVPATPMMTAAVVSTAVRPADSPSPTGAPQANVTRPIAAVRPVDPLEATQLAVCFALDYLSWDEDDPHRRRHALQQYLPDGVDPTTGWDGTGRHRADAAQPGRIEPDGYQLWIDVRVRVTPYARSGPHPTTAAPGDPPLPDEGRWSAAPAPTARGWLAHPSIWLRLAVPVRRHDSGALVVALATVPEPDPPQSAQQPPPPPPVRPSS